jgi:hypothetical protein
MQKTNQAICRMLGERLRDLMPLNAAATVDMQVLVLRLALKETSSAEVFGVAGRNRAGQA